MATMVNILDPDVIVLGGGLSNIERLYRDLPPLVETYAFNLGAPPRIVKNMHGDSSGVRGAAWLWPDDDESTGPPSAATACRDAAGRTQPCPHLRLDPHPRPSRTGHACPSRIWTATPSMPPSKSATILR